MRCHTVDGVTDGLARRICYSLSTISKCFANSFKAGSVYELNEAGLHAFPKNYKNLPVDKQVIDIPHKVFIEEWYARPANRCHPRVGTQQSAAPVNMECQFVQKGFSAPLSGQKVRNGPGTQKA